MGIHREHYGDGLCVCVCVLVLGDERWGWFLFSEYLKVCAYPDTLSQKVG